MATKKVKQPTLFSVLSKDSSPTMVLESATKKVVRKVKPVAKGQSTLVAESVEMPEEATLEESPLTSEDPDVAAFYASRTPAELRAHTLAVEKLATSYNVRRTRGFLEWQKTRAK
jgi:hypothetical protein